MSNAAGEDLTRDTRQTPGPARSTIILVSAIVAALFALVSIEAFRNPNVLPHGLYTYDEADYVYAVEKGLLANYLDEGAISIGSFVEAGLAAGFDTSKWRELSRFIRSTDDVTFYRHFHGPMYFYWLAVVQAAGFTSETAIRYASLCSVAFTALALVLFLAALFPAHFAFVSMPVTALLVTGPSVILTANHVTPHALYMLPSLVTLGTLSLYCATRRTRYWYGSVVSAAVAFATLEYALFLVVTMATTLVVFRKSLLAALTRDDRVRFALTSLACFVLPLALTWPGGILKLTLVKNYCYYVYYTLIRGGSYGRSSLNELWMMRLEESPAEYLVVFSTIISLALIVKRYPHLFPPALYGLLIFLTTMRNKSTFPQYVSSAFPVFYLIAAAGLDLFLRNHSRRVKLGVTTLLLAIVTLSSVRFFTTQAETSRQKMPFQITSLDEVRPLLVDDDLPVMVNQPHVPVLHYYFPESNLYAYTGPTDSLDTIIQRLEHVIRSEQKGAIVVIDNPGPDTGARVRERFSVQEAGTIFLSPRVPRANWYRVGGTAH